MTIKKLFAAVAMTAIATTGAHAAGFYAGAGLGLSSYSSDEFDNLEEPGITFDKKDSGFKFMVGGQISPNFAVEAGYVSLGKAKLSANGVNARASVEGTGLFIDLVGIAPISGDVSLFGKIGIFNGKVAGKASANGESESASESGTDVKFGFGVSYALSKSVDLRGEWERYRFKPEDIKINVDLLSVGVIFKF